MTADTICIYPVGDGVCGHEWHEHMSPAIDLGLPYDGDVCRRGACPCREYAPGTKCPTCGGSGEIESEAWSVGDKSGTVIVPCPTCADSPVRGMVKAE